MIELFDDPDSFLAVAEDHLRADPVVSTVLATATLEIRRDRAAGTPLPDRPSWWAVARGGDGRVAGCAFRSPTPFPPYLLPMPDHDAAELAQLLHERGEDVRGASGTTESCEAFAEGWTSASGGTSRVLVRSRLFEMVELAPPIGARGELRQATEDDLDAVVRFLDGFQRDAELQAGRDPGDRAYDDFDPEIARRRIREGVCWLWVTDAGPVSFVGDHEPAYGAARVGPVYTAPEHRGHGYAAAATAAVSAMVLGKGARPCLFTDLANPTSSGVYTRIGYRPVRDTVELSFMERADWAHGLA